MASPAAAHLRSPMLDAGLGKVAQPKHLTIEDFASVYEAHVSRIYGFVFSQVANREEAEDLTSQVFLKVYNSLGRFEGRGTLEGWLFQIARVTVNDHWREKYKLPASPMPEGMDIVENEIPRDFNRAERDQRVQQILDKLPQNYRDVLFY